MSTGILDKHTIDTTSLDQDTYYPVVMSIGATLNVRIEVIVALNSDSKPNWSTHPVGFSCRFIEEVNGWGWGNNTVNRTIYASDYLWTSNSINPIGGVGQLTKSSNEFIYVRGGGKYHFYISDKIVPVLIKDTFTLYDESISPTKTPTFNNVRTNFLSTDLAPVLNNIEKKIALEIDKIQVGGRNLFLNSKNQTLANLWYYIPGLKDDEEITVQIWGKGTIYCYEDNGWFLGGSMTDSTDYKKLTYKVKPHTSSSKSNGMALLVISCTDANIKVERGNTPTDWTPAPEDSTYEEGTWTPIVEGSSTQGVAQYTVSNARYVRTGNMITAFFDTSGKFTTAPTGACIIKGLPYQGGNNANGVLSLSIGYAEQNVYFAIQGNTLVSRKQNGKNSDIVAAVFGTDLSNTNFHLYGNISYFIG